MTALHKSARKLALVLIGVAITAVAAAWAYPLGASSVREPAFHPLWWSAIIAAAGLAGALLRADARRLHLSHRMLFAR